MSLKKPTQTIIKWFIYLILALAAIAFVSQLGHAQVTTTTLTGTVKGLDNVNVSSGKVVLTLKQSIDTTITGNARFTPTAVTCKIVSGLIKAFDGASACTVVKNTSLTPAGTSYQVDICPLNSCTSRVNMYAIQDSVDISTLVPTPTTSPINNLVDSFSTQTITGNKTFTGPISVQGTMSVTGDATLSSLNTIKMADQATGADWCAKTLAALAANNEAFVNQNSTPGSCTTNITMPSGSVIHFIQAGHYVLSTFNIIAGTNTNVVCDTRGVVIDYSGTVAAWDDNTVTGAETNGCTWNALTASPVAVVRIRNTGNAFNMNARVKAKLTATTYSAGQIGLLVQGDGATSANYRSSYDIETDNIDIAVRNVSLVNNQSPNGNMGIVRSNGHTVALDAMDMTDSMWTVLALGAHTAGTAIRLCATGNGGSGVGNNVFIVSSEQGGASTTISVASSAGLSTGCGNSLIIGQTNDVTQYSDVNSPCTNNVMLNTIYQPCNRNITGTGALTMGSGKFTGGSLGATGTGSVPSSTAGDLYAIRTATTGFLFFNAGCFFGQSGATSFTANCGTGTSFNMTALGSTINLAGATSGTSTISPPATGGVNSTLPSTAGPLGVIVASGTSTFTTTAVGAGTCQTTVTTTATGAANTDAIEVAYASAPAGTTDGLLILDKWATSGNVNFSRCNPTAASITPTALVLNWKVVR